MSGIHRRARPTSFRARLGRMEPHLRWSRPLVGLGLILSVPLLAGCAAGAGPTMGASTAPVASPGASEVAASTPAPTNLLTMSTAFLPTPSFNASKVAVACDQASLGAGVSMTCDDIVALSVRVAATMSKNPVTQVSVTKPTDNPSAIQVTFWVQSEDASGLTAFTSTIDPANQTVTFPVEDSEAVFPTAS